MTDNTYNGWTNRNTWAVNLHWGDYWSALAEDGETLTEDSIRSDVEAFVDEALDAMPEGQRLFFGDMMDMWDVNWGELARQYEREDVEAWPMTRAQHTPGPWAYKDSKIIAVNVRPDWATDEDDADERVCVIDLYGAMGGDDTRADARLIAAAPELLAALQEVANRGYMFDHDAPLYRQCLDAIAKATRPTDWSPKPIKNAKLI
jgi:hypothetical protein